MWWYRCWLNVFPDNFRKLMPCWHHLSLSACSSFCSYAVSEIFQMALALKYVETTRWRWNISPWHLRMDMSWHFIIWHRCMQQELEFSETVTLQWRWVVVHQQLSLFSILCFVMQFSVAYFLFISLCENYSTEFLQLVIERVLKKLTKALKIFVETKKRIRHYTGLMSWTVKWLNLCNFNLRFSVSSVEWLIYVWQDSGSHRRLWFSAMQEVVVSCHAGSHGSVPCRKL